MHPDPAFRIEDRALFEAMVDQIGFGMVFLETPDGPRVAHTPLLSTGDGAVQFHLARGNALARHIDGANALVLLNGPDGYVSPRWYAEPDQVPTWNYVSLEMEGRVRRMDQDGLYGLLEALSNRNEEQVLEGEPWTIDKIDEKRLRQMMGAIVGFEMEVVAWRPTFKLSQNKPAEERERVAQGLEREGATAIAQMMRTLVGTGRVS
ncbi:MAG: FMN-binding negative transcriptional regulator [Sphingomonadales bacterium]|nr:FMN-binding negative transcriptional regulator [Sphingomonadales bacterium]MDE2567482.1 FMN-binding negative transcriptional regulator [Sphingomonadales bacterium]